ncbi:MAG: hypothetical protein P1U58_13820 [Verrucomicrobiales bacterium]|nr:hypothetical protein [Verrucomicrobiales bacterium]
MKSPSSIFSEFPPKALRGFFLAALAMTLSQCETMETGETASGPTITVEGTLFYPDEVGATIIIPVGAQVIGAGGKDCHYIVQAGGSLTAHSGESNTFKINAGGHFRGFSHPATNCVVTYEEGAIIEPELGGPGTRFEAL